MIDLRPPCDIMPIYTGCSCGNAGSLRAAVRRVFLFLDTRSLALWEFFPHKSR